MPDELLIKIIGYLTKDSQWSPGAPEPRQREAESLIHLSDTLRPLELIPTLHQLAITETLKNYTLCMRDSVIHPFSRQSNPYDTPKEEFDIAEHTALFSGKPMPRVQAVLAGVKSVELTALFQRYHTWEWGLLQFMPQRCVRSLRVLKQACPLLDSIDITINFFDSTWMAPGHSLKEDTDDATIAIQHVIYLITAIRELDFPTTVVHLKASHHHTVVTDLLLTESDEVLITRIVKKLTPDWHREQRCPCCTRVEGYEEDE